MTGIHVILIPCIPYRTEMLEDTRERYARDSRSSMRQYLAVIEKAAQEAGVTGVIAYATRNQPREVMISTAAEWGSNLIMMASHGRRGGARSHARQRDAQSVDP